MALTDLDERATVLSIHGIGAFDLISRVSMLEGLRSVLHFYGNPSSFFLGGTTHEIRQGEGGEQGDPLMPMLYVLGQHPALCAIQRFPPCLLLNALVTSMVSATTIYGRTVVSGSMLARRKSGTEPEWCLPVTMPS